jgi:predicted transcriptional regulator
MSSPVETCQDWLTVQRFLGEEALRTRHSTLPLIDFDGRPSGVLHPRLARIPAHQRETLRLRDVAIPWERCTTCAPDDPLQEVLEGLSPARGLPVLVTEGERLLGIITAHDISRLVQRQAVSSANKQ